MEIQEVPLAQTSPAEYDALTIFLNALQTEADPEMPPVPVEERVRRWQSLPPYSVLRMWAIRHPEQPTIVAVGRLGFQRVEHNRHVADFSIGVLPEFRRRGLARRLLAPVAAAARQEARTLLIAFISSTVPAGEAFMQRLGGRMGLPLHVNQLDVQEVNRDLLRQWQQRARERAAGFELLLWDGRVPDEHLEAFVGLVEAMNLAPRGDLQVEDFHVTPERIRLFEQAEADRGDQRWRFVARERATGALAGYTEVIWHPNRAQFLQQGDTAVLAAYQNRGLGRWMKAAMLEKVLRERPEVRWIRTGNAFVNEPMLKINRELGFHPHHAAYIWQVEVDKVEAYLQGERNGGLG